MSHHRAISRKPAARALLIALAAAWLAACQSAPKAPPPPPELVGGPCKYDEAPAVAVVSDADAEQVRFLIDNRLVPYSRQDLPNQFNYEPGAEFNVIEKRITQGTCTPYILEVVGPSTRGAAQLPPPPPARQTTQWRFPDPSLK